jgi:hypothetical protein
MTRGPRGPAAGCPAGRSSATKVSSSASPSWSIAGCHAVAGTRPIASISVSVHDQPTENSQCRPRSHPRWRCGRAGRGRTPPRPTGPGRCAGRARAAARRPRRAPRCCRPRSWRWRCPGGGRSPAASPVLSQVARLGANPMPPLYVARAFSFSEAAGTIVASKSTTVIPVSSRPATVNQGNPSLRSASRAHQCRRKATTAVFTRPRGRLPGLGQGPPQHRRGRRDRPDHRGQVHQRPDIADRLTAQNQHQGQI